MESSTDRRLTEAEKAAVRPSAIHEPDGTVIGPAVLECDLDHRFVAADGPLLVQMGVEADEVVGRHVSELMPADRAERFCERHRLAAAGTANSFEWETLDDRTLCLDMVPLRDRGRRITGVMVLARDISERKRIDRGPHLQAELMDRIDAAVIAVDVEGRVTHWNRQAEEYYDAPRAMVLGRPVAAVNAKVGLPDPSEGIEELKAGGTRTSMLTVVRPDGSTLPILATSSPVYDAQGAVGGFVSVHVDMTEARRAEAQKAALEAQLHRAQRLEGIGRLAGGIAHDFNNLLAVILSYSTMVAAALPEGDLREDVEQIQEAAERAARLTRQLLVFGRREVVRSEPVDVAAVMADIEKLLRRAIGEDVSLTVTRPSGPCRVRADRGQLEQVALNLAVNARDAMPAGGSLDVTVERVQACEGESVPPGPHVAVRFTDSGCGMAPKVLEQAFEPFFTTKPPTAGSGLGLATVYAIVRQAGGHVELTSAPGKGTTVLILLPACLEPVEEREVAPDPQPARGRGEHVLVVEDDAAVRALVVRLLRDGGYGVTGAADPEAALVLAGELRRPIDLLLTDVVMPGMSGTALVAALAPARPGMRVLFMSGYAEDVVVRHGVREHQITLLEKPFTREELLGAVRSLLDSPRTPEAVNA